MLTVEDDLRGRPRRCWPVQNDEQGRAAPDAARPILPTAWQRYKELLTHVSSVTRNESSDSVNGILDTVSVSDDLRMVRRGQRDARISSIWQTRVM